MDNTMQLYPPSNIEGSRGNAGNSNFETGTLFSSAAKISSDLNVDVRDSNSPNPWKDSSSCQSKILPLVPFSSGPCRTAAESNPMLFLPFFTLRSEVVVSSGQGHKLAGFAPTLPAINEIPNPVCTDVSHGPVFVVYGVRGKLQNIFRVY
jgi:hypothetical protein